MTPNGHDTPMTPNIGLNGLTTAGQDDDESMMDQSVEGTSDDKNEDNMLYQQPAQRN